MPTGICIRLFHFRGFLAWSWKDNIPMMIWVLLFVSAWNMDYTITQRWLNTYVLALNQCRFNVDSKFLRCMPAWASSETCMRIYIYGRAWKGTYCPVQTVKNRISLHIRHIQYKNPRDSKIGIMKTLICHCITVQTWLKLHLNMT